MTHPGTAVYRHSSYGPAFGAGHDFVIKDHANTKHNSRSYFGSSYPLPRGAKDRRTILAGSNWFTPDEVEVFYLG